MSDTTYLRKYSLSNDTDLVNRLYVEHFSGRNSITADAYYFKSLLARVNGDNIPWVAPLVDVNHDFGDILGDGRLMFNGNMMILGTPGGLDSRRVSTTFSWEKPFTSAAGQVYRFFASVRGDIYSTEKAPIDTTPAAYHGTESIVRVLPTAGVEVSYPFVNSSTSLRQVIEPVGELIVAPYIRNNDKIPNQDSLAVEFDDTNLFSENRFPGYDRWESGSRASLGLRYSVFGNDGAQASFLFGQSYRMQEDDSFGNSSGLRDQKSDYVGSIQMLPMTTSSQFTVSRLNRNNFKFQPQRI